MLLSAEEPLRPPGLVGAWEGLRQRPREGEKEGVERMTNGSHVSMVKEEKALEETDT